MKIKALALASAVVLSGFAAVNASAQGYTETHETPGGAVVTRHVERSEDAFGNQTVHRTTRVVRPDGTTVIRHTRFGDRDDYFAPHRTVVIHHRYYPMNHVVVRTVRHRPAYVINRHVTVIHDEG